MALPFVYLLLCDWQIEAAFSFGSGLQHGPASALKPAKQFFRPNSVLGSFVESNMDFQLDSVPPIEFRRAYLSGYVRPMALGFGTNHSYNSSLYSDGAANLTFMDIIREDGDRNHLDRISPGRGFRAVWCLKAMRMPKRSTARE